MYPISAFGSEQQREKYLPGMAQGNIIGCFGPKQPMMFPCAMPGRYFSRCCSLPKAEIGYMHRLDCTETKLRSAESPRSSSWQISPELTELRSSIRSAQG